MDAERAACDAQTVRQDAFNPLAVLPFGLRQEHLHDAMSEFCEFLTSINVMLYERRVERLETLIMPANFSSVVGEFVAARIPRYCSNLVRNEHHNGYPDLIPNGKFPNNTAQYADEGIEIKASRYSSGWQGHNAEQGWLMVFVFDSNRPSDAQKQLEPRPFRFVRVLGAALSRDDWSFSGRSETSRRTITASVTHRGYEKMFSNWIYDAAR